MTDHTIVVADRRVGDGERTYVIAEISANHAQSYERAAELVAAAAESGADAVKLQTYTPGTMTIDSSLPHFQIGSGTVWEGRNLYDLYAEAMTPWEWHADLKREAEARGMHLFSTPFDQSALEYLVALQVPAVKIASFELVDLPLIRACAASGLPLIMSTGMATVSEIDAAVVAARDAGAEAIALLRCNSGYPAKPAEMDLRTIPHMRDTWGVPIGLSDHTLGVTATVAAVALGATIVEKHITLARSEGGPDAGFSLEPDEFRHLVECIREVESAVGGVRYGPSQSEIPSLAFRRSLFVVEAVSAGDTFTSANVRAIRPAGGLPPDEITRVLDRKARVDVQRGTPLTWDLVGG